MGNMLALVQYPIFGRPLKGSTVVGNRGVCEIIRSFSLVDTVGSLFPDAACIYIYILIIKNNNDNNRNNSDLV